MLELTSNMAQELSILHEFTAIRADYVNPAREHEYQLKRTEHDERERILSGKELHLNQIQKELEFRQLQFECQCKSRSTRLAERERQLNE
jgi:hypothetical protein